MQYFSRYIDKDEGPYKKIIKSWKLIYFFKFPLVIKAVVNIQYIYQHPSSF